MTAKQMRGIKPLARAAALFAGACLALAMAAPAASAAPFGVTGFDGSTALNAAGDPATQAGSHPYSVGATINFASEEPFPGYHVPTQNVKDIDVELPAGLVGDPSAVDHCPVAVFQATQSCPEDTQVGTVAIEANGAVNRFAVWSLTPPPGKPALFGFVAFLVPVTIESTVRPAAAGAEGFGLDLHFVNISQALPLVSTSLTFWGDPSDPNHDEERGACLVAANVGESPPPGGCPYRSEPKAFLTLPTSCTGTPPVTRLHVTAWNGEEAGARFASHGPSGEPTAVDGCQRVPFAGAVATALERAESDSPSGLDYELKIPRGTNPKALAPAHLKRAVVTLPPGFSVNPAAANALATCSEAEFGQFSAAPAQCPAAAAIGSVAIDSRLLEDPLTGSVFVARQGENPFGSLLALYLVAEADGVRLKLPGKVDLDPLTGRVVVSFDNNPQLPFERISLSFFGGPRAALATPVTCGAGEVSSLLGPWSGTAPAALAGSLAIDARAGGGACPASAASRPFSPVLEAGTRSNAAGGHSAFTLQLNRADGSQELGRVDATLPRGLLATLKGVRQCGEGDAAAGTCPEASRIGSVTVGAGAGSDPYFVRNGRAYLTGPYRGAPFGLDFVVPAVAGPFDLGLVNVRAAVAVDPETAQVSVRSDELPHILAGIPLRLRMIRLEADREGFMLNPTSCEPSAVAARATSTEGTAAALADRFQAAGCRGLRFSPRVGLKLLGGRKALNRRRHPPLRVTVSEPAGQANPAAVAVTLPHSILLDQGHIRTVCTRVQFAADACPRGAVYGHATVSTPLLDEPLGGPVYLRSSSHKLPDLVVDLKGQIEIVLAGTIGVRHGGIRTVFSGLPDAPISRFSLTMKGGAKGLLQNSSDLCEAKSAATVRAVGQNGARHDSRLALARSCGGRKAQSVGSNR